MSPPRAARSAAVLWRAANACWKAADGVGDAGVSSGTSFALDPANAIDPSIDGGRIGAASAIRTGAEALVVLLMAIGTNEARDRLRLWRESPASEPSQDRRVVGLGARMVATSGGTSAVSSRRTEWSCKGSGTLGSRGAREGEGVRAARFDSMTTRGADAIARVAAAGAACGGSPIGGRFIASVNIAFDATTERGRMKTACGGL